MAAWPFYSPNQKPGTARGTTATVGAIITVTPTAGSMGATWVNVEDPQAATVGDACGFWFIWTTLDSSATARAILVDLGISTDGTTYSTVVQNLDMGANYKTRSTTSAENGEAIWVPCYIKSGSRIGCRANGNVATTFTCAAIQAGPVGMNGPLLPGYHEGWITTDTHPDTYGRVVATSRGTAVTPSATANTYGTAVNFATSNTAAAYCGVLIGIGNNAETASTAAMFQVKIDDGTNILSDNIIIQRQAAEGIMFQNPRGHQVLFPSTLPINSTLRVSVRSATASMTALTVTLHGLRV